MSDTSQGQGWWLASDGKWYPPEAWTGPPRQTDATYATAGAMPNPGMPSYVQAPGAQGYPGYPAYGTPVGGYQQYAAPAPNNGMAIASLVCSLVGVIPFLFGIPCILGIIFGFVARNQIKNSQGRQRGGGMALAGIIVGFSLIGLWVLIISLVAAFGHTTSCFGSAQFCNGN
jgi:hypothetical protein